MITKIRKENKKTIAFLEELKLTRKDIAMLYMLKLYWKQLDAVSQSKDYIDFLFQFMPDSETRSKLMEKEFYEYYKSFISSKF